MFNVVLRESNKISDKVFDEFQGRADNNEFELHDGVIIGLFEDLIAKINSLKVLIDAKCYDSHDIISRSIFEAHVYLKYILSQDTKERGSAYAKSAKLSEFKLYDKLIEESKVGKDLRESLGMSIDDLKNGDLSVSDEAHRSEVTNDYLNLLNTSSAKTLWYNADGKTGSFEQLCIKQGLRNEYEILYRIFSRDVHSNNALSRLKISNNMVQVGNFNIDPKLNTNMSAIFLVESSRSVMEYYKLKQPLRSFNTMLKINHLI
ncbi:DUF5677 domain-containing protein [Planococcus halocryophilus]|nr:DUF5677 domain-containing protein [Planococcus halocryophilus]